MDYQQITLAYAYQDEDGAQSTQIALKDDAAGDLQHVLTQLTHFLRAAGFTYVEQLVAHTADDIHSGEDFAV
jgi:hypothetical protein